MMWPHHEGRLDAPRCLYLTRRCPGGGRPLLVHGSLTLSKPTSQCCAWVTLIVSRSSSNRPMMMRILHHGVALTTIGSAGVAALPIMPPSVARISDDIGGIRR